MLEGVLATRACDSARKKKPKKKHAAQPARSPRRSSSAKARPHESRPARVAPRRGLATPAGVQPGAPQRWRRQCAHDAAARTCPCRDRDRWCRRCAEFAGRATPGRVEAERPTPQPTASAARAPPKTCAWRSAARTARARRSCVSRRSTARLHVNKNDGESSASIRFARLQPTTRASARTSNSLKSASTAPPCACVSSRVSTSSGTYAAWRGRL